MSIAKCYSAQLSGLSLEVITVEVDISNGLNAVSIVGLGDRAVEEAKDRVSAAIKNSGFTSPKQKNQKVVISLAPADIRKEGPIFDLAIALSYLSVSGDVMFDSAGTLFLGELSLEGEVKRVAGVLPILCQARSAGFSRVFIPRENELEASLARGLQVYAVRDLGEVIEFFNGRSLLEPLESRRLDLETVDPAKNRLDMGIIRGNESAKRGLEIAAAGGHNILMFGPPGTGKTMLAQAFPTILPALTEEEAVEVTGIHSAAKVLSGGLMMHPPFRAPHHTASYPAVVGGGAFPRPGEITLAHRGVLFLDEFPEFDRSVLEALRQPLEERLITIARARGSVTFPAQCILIASMNPCPCGRPQGQGCECSAKIVTAYRRRVSGPIMDRLDLWINVNKVDYEKLAAQEHVADSSMAIKSRVVTARGLALRRFAQFDIIKRCNAEMNVEDIDRCVDLSDSARRKITDAAKKLSLSGRAFHRIIKVARTIADLAASKHIEAAHILEAIQYRQKMD